MITDDIVALLPDLRAFSRFLCREREAADDLVQNTILSALDKQEQFEPGTNLKGWLFTIMRNRFYSDLRTQRRRPASIDSDTAPMLTASADTFGSCFPLIRSTSAGGKVSSWPNSTPIRFMG